MYFTVRVILIFSFPIFPHIFQFIFSHFPILRVLVLCTRTRLVRLTGIYCTSSVFKSVLLSYAATHNNINLYFYELRLNNTVY